MSRQQQRQKLREIEKIKNEIAGITPKTMEALKKALAEVARIETQREFLEIAHCMYSTALNADHKFGKKRMNKLIEAVNRQFTGVIDGTIDARTDIVEWCALKGIDFVLEVENESVAV